jgi:hypothetical protein
MSIVTETKSYTVDWAALAESVEVRVMQKMKDDLAHWSGELCEIGMREMFLRDAADGLAVCEAMLDKEMWSAVENKLRAMDTAARDCVYDMIAAEAGEDFFDIVR